MTPSIHRFLLAVVLLLPLSSHAQQPDKVYRLNYTIELLPEQDAARVTIRLGEGAHYVSRINFRIHPERQSDFKADGDLSVEGQRAIWHPPAEGGTFSLLAKVSHERKGGKYDALMTKEWARFPDDVLWRRTKLGLTMPATDREKLAAFMASA